MRGKKETHDGILQGELVNRKINKRAGQEKGAGEKKKLGQGKVNDRADKSQRRKRQRRGLWKTKPNWGESKWPKKGGGGDRGTTDESSTKGKREGKEQQYVTPRGPRKKKARRKTWDITPATDGQRAAPLATWGRKGGKKKGVKRSFGGAWGKAGRGTMPDRQSGKSTSARGGKEINRESPRTNETRHMEEAIRRSPYNKKNGLNWTWGTPANG